MQLSRRLLLASKSSNLNYDVTIVGGGIVGCATAREIKLNRPNLKVALIEKEEHLGLFFK